MMIFEGDVWKAIIDISKDMKRIADTLERNRVKAITDEEFDSMLARLIADRKTEPMETTDYCDVCNHKGCDNCVADGSNSYCVPSHYEPKDEPQKKYPTEWCEDCNLWREDNCMGVAQCKANMKALMEIYEASKIEPLPTAINGVQITSAVAWADKWLEDNPISEMWDMIRTLRDATEWQTEPQTERRE